MTCTYCKADNPEDCLYCPNCGKPAGGSVDSEEAPGTPSKSAQPGTAINSDHPRASLSADMPGPQNAQLAQANLNRLRKNWIVATDLCIAVLREAPADPAAHSLLGDIYRDQSKLDEAVRWYRMALDLSPNPFDQANLQKLERQIASDGAREIASSGANPPAAFDSLSGSLSDGTSALMGVAPQKWLKGITVSALTFVCLFVVYLILLPTRKVAPVPQAVSSDALASDVRFGADSLPPVSLGGPTSLPAGEQAAPVSPVGRVAGMGLAPDIGTSTVPPMSSVPTQTSGTGAAAGGVPPAPVRSVSPTPPGSTIGSDQVSTMVPSPYHPGEHSNNLSGGIQAGRVDASNGAATIQLIASDATTPHEVLIRNLYRAARTVFSNDTTLQRATVIVHAETADGASLITADLDRSTAMAADPNTDDVAALTGRLRIH